MIENFHQTPTQIEAGRRFAAAARPVAPDQGERRNAIERMMLQVAAGTYARMIFSPRIRWEKPIPFTVGRRLGAIYELAAQLYRDSQKGLDRA